MHRSLTPLSSRSLLFPALLLSSALPLSAQFTTDNAVGSWSAPEFEVIKGLRTFDVEGDGDQDIFLCRYNQSIQGNFSWYENTGQGVFAAPVALHTADQQFPDVARDFDLADKDGDGDLDLVYVTELSSNIYVRTFADGAFGDPEVWGTLPGNGLFIRWMQLNPWEDQLIDVVTHVEVNHPHGIYNTGGAFGTPFIIGNGQIGLGPDYLETGDFTGNFGDLLTYAAGHLYLYTQYADGDGGYYWDGIDLGTFSWPFQVLDVDNDGDDDIGMANNDSTGWLRSPGLYGDLQYEQLEPAFADGVFGKVDCDPYTDLFSLFFTDFYDPYISYGYDSDGPVIDVPALATGLPNTGRFPPVLVDLDEDGLNDLLMVVDDTTLHWYANDGPVPPTVTLDPFADTLVASCEDLYFLGGGLPAGGFYSGPYVGCGFAMGQQEQRGGCYISLPAPAGETTVTYTYADDNGCYGEATRPILLIDSVLVTPLTVTTCPSPDPVQINTLPATAEWVPEQPITSDGLLDVSVPYNYAVGCFYTDVLGCQAFGYTYVNVLEPSVGYVYINGSEETTVCVDAGTVEVVFSQANGVEATAFFEPAVNGPGTYTFVGYGDTTVNGCAVNDTLFLEVIALPEVTLDAFTDTLVNSCATVYPLTGGLPAGGIYSGDGVDGDFYPQGLLGDVAITYTYEDGNGCAASATQTIRVIEGISVTPNSVVQCVAEGGVQLTAQPIPEVWFDAIVSPDGVLNTAQPFNGGVYCAWTDVLGCQAYGSVYVNLTAYSEGSVSVADEDPFPEQICLSHTPFTIDRSLADGSSESIAFDPAIEGLGTYTYIGYALDDSNGCLRNDTLTFTVVDAPTVSLAAFPSLLSTCPGNGYTLFEGTPTGGTYSGDGVSNGVFSPAGLTGPVTITYTYALEPGCEGSASGTIELLDGVVADSTFVTCADGNAQQLFATPEGGVWSGDLVTPDGTLPTDETATGAAVYTYTDAAGCADSAEVLIWVTLPAVSLQLTEDSLLTNDPPYMLEGGFPLDGLYTGDAVSPEGVFDPSTAGVGWHVITFTVVDDDGCTASATDSLFVDFGTGMEAHANVPALHVWPVPTHDELFIDLPGTGEQVTLMLVDAGGREVARRVVVGIVNGTPLRWDIGSLANGSYTLWTTGRTDIAPARVVIAR